RVRTARKGGQRMLVLSRRPNEKLVLPGIHTTIQVVSVKGGTVRLGIDAPPDVAVWRAELQDRLARDGAPVAEPIEARFRALRHLVRNRLNGATIGLALLRRQVTAGKAGELDRTLCL